MDLVWKIFNFFQLSFEIYKSFEISGVTFVKKNGQKPMKNGQFGSRFLHVIQKMTLPASQSIGFSIPIVYEAPVNKWCNFKAEYQAVYFSRPWADVELNIILSLCSWSLVILKIYIISKRGDISKTNKRHCAIPYGKDMHAYIAKCRAAICFGPPYIQYQFQGETFYVLHDFIRIN